MANTIKVKFEAHGARALKSAIDQLSIAQTRLNQGSKKAERLQKKLNKELDKFGKWTPEELKEWWKSILPILKHNQDVFYEMGRNESRKNKWLREVL